MKDIFIVVSPFHNFLVPARIPKERRGYTKGSNVLVRFCALLLLLTLFGCIAIPHGKKVDVAKAEGIVVGSTTKSEIVKTFGQPPIKQTSGGVDMWMYRHTLEWGTIATGTHGHDVTELVLTFRGDLVASCQITITKINRFSGGTKSIDSHPCGKTDLKGSPRHE